jgi:hypothetical protein
MDRRAAAKNGAVYVKEKETGLDGYLPYNPAARSPALPAARLQESCLNADNPLSVDPRRLIAAIIIAAAILFAVIIGMGTVTFSSPGSVGSVTVPPQTAIAPTAAPPQGSVQGTVSVSVQRLSGHTFRFRYTVRDTGRTPIAGFQLNGAKANLFHLVDPGWNPFGSGVCNGNNGTLLIYWSTSTGAANQIAPGHSAHFGFDVNTTGQSSATYAVSYAKAAAQFGSTKGPAGSSLPASGPCK